MFKHSAYFQIVETDYATLHGQIIPTGKIFLHLKNKTPMTPDLYKTMLVDFNEICEEFKRKGVKYLFVIIKEGDEKLLKFESMMGFSVIQLLRNPKDQEVIEALVMRKEL